MQLPRVSRFRGIGLGLLLAGCSALGGCTSPEVDRVGRSSSPIYYGERENSYEGVVMLQVDLGAGLGALCSGTVVAPRVVVTAKHCVVDDTGAMLDPDDIIVGTGPTGTRDLYDVEDIRTTADGRVNGRDFAVMITVQEIDAEPYPYVQSWEYEEGQPITLVGYGQRDDGEAGIKYLGDNTLDRVFRNYFVTTGEAACHGDSGGPAFDADGVLVGVIVNTLGGWEVEDSCESGLSGITRVDSWSYMIDEAIEDAWVCDGAAHETCGDGRDNDCDRLVDNGCLELGDLCTEGAFCASGDCRPVGETTRCTSTCDVTAGAAGCPGGFYCAQVACTPAGGEGACILGEAGQALVGEACEDDTECANLSCIADDQGRRRCLQACTADAQCAAGEICSAAEGGCGGCVGVGGAAPFAAPCSATSDCASSLCAVDGSGSFCSLPCGTGCPLGFECGAAGECVHARLPGLGETGMPCAGNDDCASGLCGRFALGQACTAFCDPTNACPSSFSCAQHDGVSVCEPELSIAGADCSGNDDCLTGLCGHFDALDACTQSCGPASPCPGDLLCMLGGGGSYCQPATLEGPEPSSGGCRVNGGSGGAPASAFALLLVVLAALSRRRRS